MELLCSEYLLLCINSNTGKFCQVQWIFESNLVPNQYCLCYIYFFFFLGHDHKIIWTVFPSTDFGGYKTKNGSFTTSVETDWEKFCQIYYYDILLWNSISDYFEWKSGVSRLLYTTCLYVYRLSGSCVELPVKSYRKYIFYDSGNSFFIFIFIIKIFVLPWLLFLVCLKYFPIIIFPM